MLEDGKYSFERKKQIGYFKGAPLQSISYRQNGLFLALLDQKLHAQQFEDGKVDAVSIYRQAHYDFFGVEAVEGDDFIGRYMHMLLGYEGVMYAYLYSTSVSVEIAQKIIRDGVLDPNTYQELNDKLFSYGYSLPLNPLIRDYLGKDVQTTPLLNDLGVK